jgi:hypothetical protein
VTYNPYPAGQPNTSSMSPTQYLDWLTQIGNSPQGQAAQSAMQATIQMNVRQALAAMQNEKDRIAIARGQAEADRWYREQTLQLAREAHQLAAQTQQQNYGLAVGGLTGMFNGQPTLAAQNQQQQYALDQARLALSQLTQEQQNALGQGTLNLATLTQSQRNAIEQAQLGLNQAGITGEFNGRPTLAALAQQQQNALSWAGLSGQLPGGGQTLAAQGQLFNQGLALGAQTGYQNGAPTLDREQAAANAALQAGQLGASLQGPENWAQFLQAQNAVAGSPVSSLVASAPGGLGAMAGDPGGPMTLGSLLGRFGVMPGQGPSQPAQGASPGMWGPAPGGPIDQTGAPIGGAMPPWQPPSGAPGAGSTAPLDTNSPQYRDIQTRLGAGTITPQQAADEWARLTAGGGGQAPGQGGYAEPSPPVWAGGSPTFDEQTGTYSSAPAGGMRRTMPINPAQGGGNLRGLGLPQYTGPMSMGNSGNPGAMGADPALGPGYTTWLPPAGWSADSFAEPTPGGGSSFGTMRQQPSGAGWNPYSLTGAIGQVAQAPRVTNQQLGLSDQDADQLKTWFQNPNQAPGTWWTSKSKDQKKMLGSINRYWGGSQDTFLERERNARPRQGSVWAA